MGGLVVLTKICVLICVFSNSNINARTIPYELGHGQPGYRHAASVSSYQHLPYHLANRNYPMRSVRINSRRQNINTNSDAEVAAASAASENSGARAFQNSGASRSYLHVDGYANSFLNSMECLTPTNARGFCSTFRGCVPNFFSQDGELVAPALAELISFSIGFCNVSFPPGVNHRGFKKVSTVGDRIICCPGFPKLKKTKSETGEEHNGNELPPTKMSISSLENMQNSQFLEDLGEPSSEALSDKNEAVSSKSNEKFSAQLLKKDNSDSNMEQLSPERFIATEDSSVIKISPEPVIGANGKFTVGNNGVVIERLTTLKPTEPSSFSDQLVEVDSVASHINLKAEAALDSNIPLTILPMHDVPQSLQTNQKFKNPKFSAKISSVLDNKAISSYELEEAASSHPKETSRAVVEEVSAEKFTTVKDDTTAATSQPSQNDSPQISTIFPVYFDQNDDLASTTTSLLPIKDEYTRYADASEGEQTSTSKYSQVNQEITQNDQRADNSEYKSTTQPSLINQEILQDENGNVETSSESVASTQSSLTNHEIYRDETTKSEIEYHSDDITTQSSFVGVNDDIQQDEGKIVGNADVIEREATTHNSRGNVEIQQDGNGNDEIIEPERSTTVSVPENLEIHRDSENTEAERRTTVRLPGNQEISQDDENVDVDYTTTPITPLNQLINHDDENRSVIDYSTTQNSPVNQEIFHDDDTINVEQLSATTLTVPTTHKITRDEENSRNSEQRITTLSPSNQEINNDDENVNVEQVAATTTQNLPVQKQEINRDDANISNTEQSTTPYSTINQEINQDEGKVDSITTTIQTPVIEDLRRNDEKFDVPVNDNTAAESIATTSPSVNTIVSENPTTSQIPITTTQSLKKDENVATSQTPTTIQSLEKEENVASTSQTPTTVKSLKKDKNVPSDSQTTTQANTEEITFTTVLPAVVDIKDIDRLIESVNLTVQKLTTGNIKIANSAEGINQSEENPSASSIEKENFSYSIEEASSEESLPLPKPTTATPPLDESEYKVIKPALKLRKPIVPYKKNLHVSNKNLAQFHNHEDDSLENHSEEYSNVERLPVAKLFEKQGHIGKSAQDDTAEESSEEEEEDEPEEADEPAETDGPTDLQRNDDSFEQKIYFQNSGIPPPEQNTTTQTTTTTTTTTAAPTTTEEVPSPVTLTSKPIVVSTEAPLDVHENSPSSATTQDPNQQQTSTTTKVSSTTPGDDSGEFDEEVSSSVPSSQPTSTTTAKTTTAKTTTAKTTTTTARTTTSPIKPTQSTSSEKNPEEIIQTSTPAAVTSPATAASPEVTTVHVSTSTTAVSSTSTVSTTTNNETTQNATEENDASSSNAPQTNITTPQEPSADTPYETTTNFPQPEEIQITDRPAVALPEYQILSSCKTQEYFRTTMMEPTEKQYPWLATVVGGNRPFCSASLITESHVLTAAHFLANISVADVYHMRVHIGYRATESGHTMGPFAVRKVVKVIRHKGFSFEKLYNDIAILILDRPVHFNDNVHPICLSSGSSTRYMDGNTEAVETGWIEDPRTRHISKHHPFIDPQIQKYFSFGYKNVTWTLQEASNRVRTTQECRANYDFLERNGISITNSMVCAGSPEGNNACGFRGNSGAPLFLPNDGKPEQIGIVSWGIGCGHFPSVFTKVSAFIPWIERVVYHPR